MRYAGLVLVTDSQRNYTRGTSCNTSYTQAERNSSSCFSLL